MLFGERGIDAPLDELATRAGVGAGTVYRHFPTRDALIRELYDTAVGDLHDFAPEIIGAETGWRAIELWLERLGAWVAESPYCPIEPSMSTSTPRSTAVTSSRSAPSAFARATMPSIVSANSAPGL